MRVTLFTAVLALVVFCPACGPGHKPAQPVRGKVLVKGRPAVRAQVTFHPVEDGPDAVHPVGSVDEKGDFTLTSYVQGDGAPEGEYRVTVQWFLATRMPPGSADDYATRNYLPERYGRADASGLRATVVKGDNELPPFALQPR